MKVGCIEGLKLATVGMFQLYTQQAEGCALITIQGRRFLAFKRVRFTFWPLPAKQMFYSLWNFEDCDADDDGDGQVQANCEWDGVMTRGDFLAAGIDILK